MSGVTCPTNRRWEGDIVGCGSSNVTEPDDEGLVDCKDCGIWFSPEVEKSGLLAPPVTGEKHQAKGGNNG